MSPCACLEWMIPEGGVPNPCSPRSLANHATSLMVRAAGALSADEL